MKFAICKNKYNVYVFKLNNYEDDWSIKLSFSNNIMISNTLAMPHCYCTEVDRSLVINMFHITKR